ncbi:hypothetical protein L1987_87628 [Smallanthus sonchifolius]|nr:hypothetical protein L1987_87628 [Smallanthus sonchifolius]
MASTSASSVQKSFKYDVFLSFRGEDTRKTFVDHLYHALHQKGIITYKDDEKIEKGERISDQLIRSIEDSRFHIIVFSKNYASSSWCLDELVKIMECQKMIEHTAYPVFYDVEPTEVRNQRGSVGEAFAQHEKEGSTRKRKRTLEDVDLEKEDDVGRWRYALKEAAGLAGMELKNTFNGHEAKFIQQIVQDISLKLRFLNFSIDGKLVGMETRVKNVVSSVEIGSDDVRMIGIKGMGGGGKTTLAKAVFDHISIWFEGKSFVENVREVSKGSLSGLKELQKKVLSEVLNDQSIVEKRNSDLENMMRKMMRSRKVVIVLDDVDDIDQLEALVGELNWFKPGSRIIITTRDEQVLVAHGVHRDYIHDACLLSNKEAICLFSRYAFKREIPNQGYEELSRKVIHYALGLPLTIKVLGSHLCGRNEYEWIDAIERLKTVPLEKTLKRLELSYNGLENDQKEIFLDVVCILKGELKYRAIRILESCGFNARIGLRVLEQKSLITISNTYRLRFHDHIKEMGWNCVLRNHPYKRSRLLDQTSLITISDTHRLHFHDHIEEMGWNIVRRMHPDEPIRHNRLWIKEEIEDILVNESGTEATRCIKLMNTNLHPTIIMKGLRKMWELRFLYVGEVYKKWKVDEANQYLPDALRSLYWPGYPFSCLPKTFQAHKLVNLEMVRSNISELWEGGEKKVLNKIRFLDLTCSKLRTFDLRMTPHLEMLDLSGCVDFVELQMPVECTKLKFLLLGESKVSNLYVGLTPNLETLSLRECKFFAELIMPFECSKLKFLCLSGSKLSNLNLGMAPNLETLDLSGCIEFVELNMPVECPKLKFLKLSDSKLKFLCISGSKVSNLYVGLTQNFETLRLRDCKFFAELIKPFECSKLKFLCLSGSKLSNLNLGMAPNLETLDLSGCIEFVELNMPVECPKLKFLKLSDSKVSNLNLGMTPSLETLHLTDCKNFVKLHMPVEGLKLKFLCISGSKVSNLNLGVTPHLEILDLSGCIDLVELDMPSECPKLKFLKLSGSKLSSLNLEWTPHLEMLDLKECYCLQQIHAPVGCLKRLVYLNLSGCLRFEYFRVDKRMKSSGLGSMAALDLSAVSLDVCTLHPNNSLPKFQFKCKYDEPLPSSSGNLEKLISFGLCACTNLESFSASICGLQHLREFRLEGRIKEVPKDLWRLESLEMLTLWMKEIKCLPNYMCKMKCLKRLDLSWCILVEKLPEELGSLECLEELALKGCESLRDIPNSICKMRRLKRLDLHSCILIEKLPQQLGCLECLEELVLTSCESLRDIPNNICNMISLKCLNLEGCILVEKLPEELDRLECGSYAIIKLQTLIRRRSILEIQLQTLSRSIGLNSRNPKNEEPVVEDDDDDNEEDDVEGVKTSVRPLLIISIMLFTKKAL